MRVFLFSFWYLPDSRTAVNRIKYFKKVLADANTDVKLIYCEDDTGNYTVSDNRHKIPFRNSFLKLAHYFLQKKWIFFYKIIYFLHLVSSKRDVYDFYGNFKAIENTKGFNIGKNDVIITSAPPYSALNIGYYLKKKFGAKWIIDYRDPWTLGYPTLSYSMFANTLRKHIQRNEELKFLEHADHIITVSESLKNTFPEKYHHKISIISNGANTDEIDFSKINSTPDCFSIVYAGTIYPQQLDNTYFFDVVKKFISDNEIIPENFKLHFIGSDGSSDLEEIIQQLNLEDYVNITQRLSLEDLYDYMYDASLFLHLKYANRDKIITSKQFDYLALQKPILLPQSDKGDIAESIVNNKAGYICENKDDLYFLLQQEYTKFINREDIRIYRTESFLNSISRNYSSEKLLNLIYSESNKLKIDIEHFATNNVHGVT